MKAELKQWLEQAGVSQLTIDILSFNEFEVQSEIEGTGQDAAFYMAMKDEAGNTIKGKSAAILARLSERKVVIQPPVTSAPTEIELVRADDKCPHCKARLSPAEKSANKCGTCGNPLVEYVECPYDGNQQPSTSAKRCLSCDREIPGDASMRKRLTHLRLARGIHAAMLDMELKTILSDPIRAKALDREMESGAHASGGRFQTVEPVMLASDTPSNGSNLLAVLTNRFSMQELGTLCFDLGVDFENIQGETKGGKVLGIIEYFRRRTRTADLERAVGRMRPGAL